MPLVTVESPLKANQGYSREQFKRYREFCLKDAIERGEEVYCSHWLADILDDDDPRERMQGLMIGLKWAAKSDYAVLYVDFGVSEGMQIALEMYNQIGMRVERRSLPDAAKIVRDMDEFASDSAAYAEPELTDFS